MRRIAITALMLAALATQAKDSTERIWLDVRINNKPARLVFDTGATWSGLLPRTVQRLGLKTLPCPTNELSGFISGVTENLPVEIEGGEAHIRFVVANVPGYATPDFEGFIAWWDIGGCILRVNADRREIAVLKKLPKKISEFTRLGIVTNSGTLDIEIPSSHGTNRVLCIDSGMPTGVAIPAAEWQKWKEAHPHTPSTLGTMFTPSDGFFGFYECWADQIGFGPLELAAVAIQTAGPFNSGRYGSQYAGTLGLEALRQLDLIVDGPGGQVYIRPKKIHPEPHWHNRLGATFTPTATHTNQGIARVVDGSPAYIAGVRDGDRLLQVDEVQVQGWTADWLSRFYKPAGTKLKLKLERNGANFTTTATLRDIVSEKAAQEK